MDLTRFAEQVGSDGPVTIAGTSTRGGAVPGLPTVTAPHGIESLQPDEMTVRCGAATPVDELATALAEVGQYVALPPGGTVGGALAVGRSGIRRLGDGPVRDTLLQARYVSATGSVVTAGGPTVKNVSGFDLCRLLVGSRGTLGFLGEVILRTRPLAPATQWFSTPCADPDQLMSTMYRPVSMLWDGTTVWALLEGHPADLADAARRLALQPVDGPPPVPPGRTLVAPRQCIELGGRFLVELGVGVVHGECTVVPDIPRRPEALTRRIKAEFDPGGRMNPGVDV